MLRPPGAIGRAEPLRYDTLTAKPARFAIHDRAVFLEMLIHDDAQLRAAQELGEQLLLERTEFTISQPGGPHADISGNFVLE
jgi:hypothetical protein